jgi:hypothetical protein
MSDFKPYEKENIYKCELSKDEVLLIQKIRAISYGSITTHIVKNRIVRTETINSELSKDKGEEAITIALEVIEK